MGDMLFNPAPVEQAAEPKMTLDTSNVSPFSEDTLTTRAKRADFALGDKSPGAAVLRDQFRVGQEPTVRQQAAADANIQFQQEKLDQIKAVAASGRPVTDQEVNTIMALGTTPEANPETVIEDKFSKNVTMAAVTGVDPSRNLVFQSAFETNPDSTRDQIRTAIAAGSRRHQAKDILEQAQAAYDQIPWFNLSESGKDQMDKSGDLFKHILTGGMATYVNQHNLVKESPTNSFLPGANKLEQIQYLYLLPNDQFKPALMAAAGPGSDLWKKSPSDALNFIQAAVQFSTSDAYAENVMGILDVAGVAPWGTAGKLLGRARSMANSGGSVQSYAAAARAAEDVLRASPVPPVTPGASAMGTAQDVLRASPTPPQAGYYVPAAVVEAPDYSQRIAGTKPRNITMSAKDGVPTIQAEDGSFPVLSRTPEVGSYPVNVSTEPVAPTYTTKQGTFEFSPEGVNGKKTIYVNEADYGRLSQVLDEERNSVLLSDDKGYFVGNMDSKAGAGKEIRGSRVSNRRISTEPAEGLYPIHLNEGNDALRFEDFGSRITRVDRGQDQRVTLGPKIVAQEEVDSRKALADAIKAQGQEDAADALSLLGRHTEASDDLAKRLVDIRANGNIPESTPENIRRLTPSRASPQTYFGNASSLSAARAQELATMAVARDAKLAQAVTDPWRVERLPQEALDRGIEIAKKEVAKYNRASDGVLDQVNHWDSAANLHFVETRIGKRDKTLFDNRAQAEHFRTFQYRLGDSATVQQEGSKFYLSHVQHVDETDPLVRNTLIVTENTTPRGWWNSLLTTLTGKLAPLGSSLRTSAETTAPFQMNNRVAATHAPTIMKQAIEAAAEDLQKLGGKWTTNERHELQQILEHNRDYMSPEGVRGQFYTSALDFETAFQNMHGFLPTEKQIAAYEAYTRLSDLDWTLRELNLFRDKARQGVRNYSLPIKTLDQDGNVISDKTEFFGAVKREDFGYPSGEDANVYIVAEDRFRSKFDLIGHGATVQDVETMNKIKDGRYTILQMYDPRKKPLKDATGINDQIHFIVVDKYNERPVRFGENVEYRPGGHVIYEDQFYLSQAQVGKGRLGRDTHFGDTNIKSFPSQKEAEAWAAKYNTAREFIKNGDQAGLSAWLNSGPNGASQLPETIADLNRMFSDGTLSTDIPLVARHSSRDTFQSSEELQKLYPGLKDQFSSYNLSQNADSTFLADRGAQLNTIEDRGTAANPLYTNVPSRLVDPYTALQKGLAQITRDRWMSDYKISAAEAWVQEFGHLFDQSKLPIEKLRQNPVFYLNKATEAFDKGMMKTQPELVTAALTARKNIQQFLGARDEVGGLLQGLQLKMMENLEGKLGKDAALAINKPLEWIGSAPEYTRAAAFHAVIGTFNPVQLFQQAQGLTHILALAPTHAWHATTASALVRMYRYTEDAAILASAADKAAAMGWNRADFLEAMDSWKRAGVHSVGGETAMLSSVADPAIFKNGATTFLDKGLIFFKAGESIVRDTAWFAAYREWKATNPGRAVDNRALGEIGNRFQTLTLDMTRASNSALNEGILSVPTQFWTWNARFMEQMTGKRLTVAEKARAFAVYSAMYGIPATIGGVSFGPGNVVSAVTGIPANYQDIKKYALEKGYDISGRFMEAVMNGIPQAVFNAVTEQFGEKPSSFQRFNPSGNQVKDILDGKKTTLEILGGASGGFVKQVMDSTYPFTMYALSAFKKDGAFPAPKMNDFINIAEQVSTFNNSEKAWVGFNLGQYISKREGLYTEVDKFESVLLALGINPKRVDDMYVMVDAIKDQKSAAEKMGKKMDEDWKIAIKAFNNGDYQTGQTYMARVQAWSAAANLTKQQEMQIFQRAMKGNEAMVDSIERRFRQTNPNLQSIDQLQQYLQKK